jgi:hypothetical protein
LGQNVFQPGLSNVVIVLDLYAKTCIPKTFWTAIFNDNDPDCEDCSEDSGVSIENDNEYDAKLSKILCNWGEGCNEEINE